MKYDVQGGQEIKKLITRSFIKEAVPVQGHARTKKLKQWQQRQEPQPQQVW